MTKTKEKAAYFNN